MRGRDWHHVTLATAVVADLKIALSPSLLMHNDSIYRNNTQFAVIAGT